MGKVNEDYETKSWEELEITENVISKETSKETSENDDEITPEFI